MKKREIKFRAWDDKYQVMLCTGFNIIGEVTLFSGVEVMLSEQSKKHKDDTPSLLRLNDVEIMEYIGLKDIARVDIYEGDILESDDDFNNGDGERYEILFDTENACFFARCFSIAGGEGSEAGQRFGSYISRFKIIGNIYQNPGLLCK